MYAQNTDVFMIRLLALSKQKIIILLLQQINKKNIEICQCYTIILAYIITQQATAKLTYGFRMCMIAQHRQIDIYRAYYSTFISNNIFALALQQQTALLRCFYNLCENTLHYLRDL